MDVSAALAVADGEFDRRIRQIAPADWQRPTPCAEWDVYALVNHVVIGGGRYARLLRGGARADFVAERRTDGLAGGAVEGWASNSALCAAAFAEPGALARVVPFSTGEVSGRILGQIRVVEVVVHTWDLSRALGFDETTDPDLAAFALRAWSENALPLQSGGVPFFAPPTDAAGGADLLALLRLAGRRP
ncbi:MAG: TIGR03086 family metal-binding protein [Sporichthyaceae bacterium]